MGRSFSVGGHLVSDYVNNADEPYINLPRDVHHSIG